MHLHCCTNNVLSQATSTLWCKRFLQPNSALLLFDMMAVHKVTPPISFQPCDEMIQKGCRVHWHVDSSLEKLCADVVPGWWVSNIALWWHSCNPGEGMDLCLHFRKVASKDVYDNVCWGAFKKRKFCSQKSSISYSWNDPSTKGRQGLPQGFRLQKLFVAYFALPRHHVLICSQAKKRIVFDPGGFFSVQRPLASARSFNTFNCMLQKSELTN